MAMALASVHSSSPSLCRTFFPIPIETFFPIPIEEVRRREGDDEWECQPGRGTLLAIVSAKCETNAGGSEWSWSDTVWRIVNGVRLPTRLADSENGCPRCRVLFIDVRLRGDPKRNRLFSGCHGHGLAWPCFGRREDAARQSRGRDTQNRIHKPVAANSSFRTASHTLSPNPRDHESSG